jgi:Glutaredoxin-like domain (DUF836)
VEAPCGAHERPVLSRVLRLLGKPDCRLCHEMADVVRSVLAELGATLVELDVRDDPELQSRYALEIPVLLLGDVEIARHRTTVEELIRKVSTVLSKDAGPRDEDGH